MLSVEHSRPETPDCYEQAAIFELSTLSETLTIMEKQRVNHPRAFLRQWKIMSANLLYRSMS